MSCTKVGCSGLRPWNTAGTMSCPKKMTTGARMRRDVPIMSCPLETDERGNEAPAVGFAYQLKHSRVPAEHNAPCMASRYGAQTAGVSTVAKQ